MSDPREIILSQSTMPVAGIGAPLKRPDGPAKVTGGSDICRRALCRTRSTLSW